MKRTGADLLPAAADEKAASGADRALALRAVRRRWS
jgi:hypothetical protein